MIVTTRAFWGHRFVFGIILCLLVANFVYATAQDGRSKTVRHVYKRTAAVLRVAQRFASESHQNYGLGLAVSHHRYSEKLYRQEQMDEAIYHSLRARDLAAHVIKQNQSDILQEALYDQTESVFAKKSPSANELDRRVHNEKLITDRAAENENINTEL